tara:strand:- start:4351 stop:4965 length:615 start_codon:yes stop_codon:yes gene_type:complete
MSLKNQNDLVEELLNASVSELDTYKDGKRAGIYLNGNLAGQHYPNKIARDLIKGKLKEVNHNISCFTRSITIHQQKYHQIMAENDWIDADISKMLKNFEEESLRDGTTDENGRPFHSPELGALARLNTHDIFIDLNQAQLDKFAKEKRLYTGDYLWTFFFGQTYNEYQVAQQKRWNKDSKKPSVTVKSTEQLLKEQKLKLSKIK